MPLFKPEGHTALYVLCLGIAVSACLALLIIAGRGGILDVGAFEAALMELRTSRASFLIVAVVFCVAAFVGAPQFALFAAVIAAFGPWQGGLYSWAATLVSGSLTFWVGRLVGEPGFRKFAGVRANKLAGAIARNAFKASALIRMVPSGPFVLVNMAFGVSGARFLSFLTGLGIGCLPKILLVAMAGQGIIAAHEGSLLIAALAIVVACLIWFGTLRLAKSKQQQTEKNS